MSDPLGLRHPDSPVEHSECVAVLCVLSEHWAFDCDRSEGKQISVEIKIECDWPYVIPTATTHQMDVMFH